MPHRSAAASRFGVAAADQALSSASNFALGALIARAGTPTDLGAYGVTQIVFAACLSLQRSGVLQVALLENTPASTVSVAFVGIGLLAGLSTLVSFVAIGHAGQLLPLIVGLPLAILQDGLRLRALALGKPRRALWSDGVWFSATVALYIAAASRRIGPVSQLLWWWTAAAAVAVIILMRRDLFSNLLSSAGYNWLRFHRALITRLSGEALLAIGVQQIVVVWVGAAGGLSAVGSLRAAQLIFAPLGIVLSLVTVLAVPSLARAMEEGRAAALQRRIRGGLIALVLSASAVSMLLPDRAGKELLGTSWAFARQYRLPVALAALGSVIVVPAVMSLRVRRAGRRLLALRAITGTLDAGISGCAAFASGPIASVWASAAVQILVSPIWFRSARKASRHGRHEK